MRKKRRRVVLAMTGASGAVYGVRTLDLLRRLGHRIDMILTPAAKIVLQRELGCSGDPTADEMLRQLATVGKFPELPTLERCDPSSIMLHDAGNFAAPVASGSVPTDGMIVAPCSTGSLGAIAAGVNGHLVHRTAEVHLKHRRPLLLLVREMPLSLIHLENMATVTRAGAVVLPAAPYFYAATAPPTANDLIDTVVARLLDLLAIEHPLDNAYTP